MALTDLSLGLIEAMEEPALLLDGDRVDAANAPARALLGERIVGRDIRLVLRHPDALDLILPATGGTCEIGTLGRRDRPWALIARPLPGGAQLVRLLDRSAARAAERMRVDFVANASHELRTPLTTMIGYSETLAEPGEIDEALRTRFASLIHDEGNRMVRIIEDLMSLSRIEADRFVAPEAEVALDEIARIAMANGRALAERSGCRLQLDLSPAAPIAGDAGQLAQLADNIVANALRYGCAGPGTVTISVATEDGRAVLRVADQGEGIDPVHLPRLTERFYRADSARSRDSGGTGLGLSIVKHIAERHGARLDIRSIPGRGTTVSVAFPPIGR